MMLQVSGESWGSFFAPIASELVMGMAGLAFNGSTGSYSDVARAIFTGPRGGRYYINSSGRKVYVK